MTLAPAADGPRPPDLARAHCQLPAQGRVRIVSRFVTASRSGTLNGGVWEASLMPLALFLGVIQLSPLVACPGSSARSERRPRERGAGHSGRGVPETPLGSHRTPRACAGQTQHPAWSAPQNKTYPAANLHLGKSRFAQEAVVPNRARRSGREQVSSLDKSRWCLSWPQNEQWMGPALSCLGFWPTYSSDRCV